LGAGWGGSAKKSKELKKRLSAHRPRRDEGGVVGPLPAARVLLCCRCAALLC
jgi:hypothetical protein